MAAETIPFISPEAYLLQEQTASEKHEYYRGRVYAMAGAQPEHAYIVASVAAVIIAQTQDRPCRTGTSDLRVKIEATGLYVYPDITVTCGQPRYEVVQGVRTLLNPTLIAEVLSPSTEADDRGRKFLHYRQLESLSDYLLIAQDTPRIEHLARQSEDQWTLTIYEGLEAVVPLPSPGCRLTLNDVYQAVEFPQEAEQEAIRDHQN